MKSQKWSIEKIGPTVSTARVTYEVNSNWEHWVLLRSDAHMDNPKTNNAMAHKHMKEAVQRNAMICDFGDFFDAMQGKKDRRHSKHDVAPELQNDNYLGSMVKMGLNYFEPYKNNVALLGYGNHETAIIKNCELDLTSSLVDRLNDRGSKCVLGGYRGWIRFLFSMNSKSKQTHSVNLYYPHGGGGGGVVTKGTMNSVRRAAYLPEAHIIASGHIHEDWSMIIARERLTNVGTLYMDEQLHVCIPGYKDEFTDIPVGFHHEKERPPKPIGAQWIRFWWCGNSGKIKYECIRAK